MASSADLQARLDAIELSIASGTTRVTIDGVGSTDYRTLAELYRVRDDLKRELGIKTPSRRTVASFRSGL